MLNGLPWYRWPAVYYNILLPGASNAAGRAGHLRFDGLYYLRFLWEFESPLLLLGLAGGGVLAMWRLKRELRRPVLVLPVYLAAWAGCFLGGMSLLLKAPRGLLLAYPLFYVLTFLLLRQLVQKLPGSLSRWLLRLVVLLAVAFNLHRVQREIYVYAPTRYGQVAAWLHQQQVGRVRVGSTLSLGLRPFLTDADTLVVVLNERQLPHWRRQNLQYVLLDASWRVVGSTSFDSLRRQRPLAAWSEPLLTSPLLFLEHSEYTGLGYEETLARQRTAQLDSAQLRLYELH
jgi:hypothetical protein